MKKFSGAKMYELLKKGNNFKRTNYGVTLLKTFKIIDELPNAINEETRTKSQSFKSYFYGNLRSQKPYI